MLKKPLGPLGLIVEVQNGVIAVLQARVADIALGLLDGMDHTFGFGNRGQLVLRAMDKDNEWE